MHEKCKLNEINTYKLYENVSLFVHGKKLKLIKLLPIQILAALADSGRDILKLLFPRPTTNSYLRAVSTPKRSDRND